MTPERINQYLARLDPDSWSHQWSRGNGTTSDWWIVRRKMKRRTVPVYFGISGSHLSCQLPLVVRPLQDCQFALFRYLLMLNQELRGAKFSVDLHSRVSLTAELALEAVTFTLFRDLLQAMTLYFELYHREIELLATDPNLGTAWLALLPNVEEPKVTFVPSQLV